MSQDVLPTQALFSDQVGADVAAMFAILIGAMIAAGGGLGGGGIFVPIYILILGYPPKFAAALSQATIFGGSIVNLIMNLKKHHPTRKHRPLTDFSTLLIFEPMLLVGTIIGVLFNVIFPDILILIMLALVLTYATVRTSRKGIRLWKKETNEFKNEAKNAAETKKVNIATQSTQIDIKPSDNKDKEAAEINGADKEQLDNDDTNKSEDDARTQNIENGMHEDKNKEDHKQDNNQDNNKQDKNSNDDDETDKKSEDTESEKDKPRASQVPFIQNGDNSDAPHNKTVIATDPSQSEQHEPAALQSTDDIEQLAKGCGVDAAAITEDKIELCKEFIQKESEVLKPAIAILVVWFFVSLFSLLKKAMVDCSAGYWFMTFLPFPIMVAFSYFVTKKEYDYYQVKINSDVWIPAFGDIKLEGNFVRILQYPLIASIAGILGGLLGIGGGMIVSPLLIELGVIPTVAAATSAMAVMITSSSAMLQFLLLGFLQWDYTLFFMIVGITGTYIGQTVVNHAVKKYGRVSVVIFAVAIVMGLAIILMMINGFISLVDGVSWGFAPPC